MNALLEAEILDVTKDNKGYSYVVAVNMPNGTIAILSNAIDATGVFGGIFDNSQTIRRTSKSSGESIHFSNSSEDSKTIGERVLVGLINGDSRRPVILGGLKHPMSSNNLPDVASTDPQFMAQFLGMKFEITPEGNFNLSHRGPTDVKPGSRIPSYKPENLTEFSMTEDGSWSIYDSEDQGIESSRTGKSLIISAGDNVIILDKEQNKLIVSFDGDISISSKKNTNIKVEGETNIICNKSVTVKSNDTITLDGSGGKLKLKKNKVALGTDTAEIFKCFTDFLDSFVDAAPKLTTCPSGPGILDPILMGKAIELSTKLKAITEEL